jgi:hypothetical protein
MMPVWTSHAKRRSEERFPELDLELLFQNSRSVGKSLKKQIKRLCPVAATTWMSGGFKGRYFRIGAGKIVFVIQAPETIVTVFRLGEKEWLNPSDKPPRSARIAQTTSLSGCRHRM